MTPAPTSSQPIPPAGAVLPRVVVLVRPRPAGATPLPAEPALARPPAAAPPAPRPEPSAWAFFWRRVRAQPGFFAFLLAIVAGSPFLLSALQQQQRELAFRRGLDYWQGELEAAGLPLPWLPPARVPAPEGIDTRAAERVSRAQRARFAALDAWRALLAGATPPALEPARAAGDPLVAAVAACAALREGDLRHARDLVGLAPRAWAQGLTLALELEQGEAARVLAQLDTILNGSQLPGGTRPALAALAGEAARRHASALLATRPASVSTLTELASLARRRDLALGPLLAGEGPRLADLVTPGPGDLERGQRLLEALELAFPDGVAAGLGEEAWAAVRTRLGAVLAAHLGQVETAPGPALALLARVAALDPAADLPPLEAYAQWRRQLQDVIDDPARLTAFSLRFLGAGWLPLGLEELVQERLVSQDDAAWGEGPGGLLGRLLVAVLRIDRASGADSSREVEHLLEALERALGGRADPAARRARALAAFLRGRALAAAGQREAADAAFAQAVEHGFEPAPLLLAARQRVASAPGEALRFATERVAAWEAHADRLRAGLGERAELAWELAGYPVEPRILDPLRALARLDRAELRLHDGDEANAWADVQAALKLTPQAARAHLLAATLLARRGARARALQSVERGLAAATPDQTELRRALEALEAELRR